MSCLSMPKSRYFIQIYIYSSSPIMFSALPNLPSEMSSELLNVIVFSYLKFLFTISPLTFSCSLHIFLALIFICLNIIVFFKNNVGLMFSVFKIQRDSLFALYCFSSGFVYIVYSLCDWPSFLSWSWPSEKYTSFLRPGRTLLFAESWTVWFCLVSGRVPLWDSLKSVLWLGVPCSTMIICKPKESNTVAKMSQVHFILFLLMLGSTLKYSFPWLSIFSGEQENHVYACPS